MKGYGERMKKLRNEAGYNQKDIAKELGITQAAMSDLEGSIYPPLNRIVQICEFLKKPVWTFFLEESEQNSFLPPDVYQEDVEYIQMVNRLPETKRHKIKKMLNDFLAILFEK